MMLVLVLILAAVFLKNFGGDRWIELILRVFSVQYVVSTLVPINYTSKFCFTCSIVRGSRLFLSLLGLEPTGSTTTLEDVKAIHT